MVRALEADGRGHPTPFGRIPIVPAAILFDLGVGDASVRPGAAEGAAAYAARSTAPVGLGPVGAGTGASVGVWRGIEHVRPSGLGSAAAHAGDATVAALVALNAAGDVFTLEGAPLTGGGPVPGPPQMTPGTVEQTTLIAIATDAALTRSQLGRVIVRAHDALGVCVRPVHTQFDGDVVFAVACGRVDGDVEGVGAAAFEVTGRAIERAVRGAEEASG